MEDFERLTSQVPRLSDEQFLGYFNHGLKQGIWDVSEAYHTRSGITTSTTEFGKSSGPRV